MRPAEWIAALALSLPATASLAADAQQGRFLYETYCGTCHYEKLHERKATQVDTLAKLRAEVGRWSTKTPRTFTAAEIEEVVEYLNRSHYRLAK